METYVPKFTVSGKAMRESRDKSRDKDANQIRRAGGKKFGSWEVVA